MTNFYEFDGFVPPVVRWFYAMGHEYRINEGRISRRAVGSAEFAPVDKSLAESEVWREHNTDFVEHGGKPVEKHPMEAGVIQAIRACH